MIAIHPAAAVFPMLTDDELADLAEDIKANGLLHPIVLDADGVLIDGRNRYAACELAGVAPRFTTLPDDVDPVAYILAANVARRHLTQAQRAMAAAQVRLLSKQPMRAAAADAGTSAARVAQAAVVIEWAPELVDAVMAGGSLNEAYQHALDRKHERLDAAAHRERLRTYLDEQRTRHAAEIEAARTAIGPRATIPPEPALDVTFTPRPDGTIGLGPVPGFGDNLDREAAFLARLRHVKQQVAAVAEEPPIEDAWQVEGHVMSVRSWASQIVTMVYEMVGRYNAALEDGRPLRRVK
jgi:ParB-like chromosome segregation protein Spo0J